MKFSLQNQRTILCNLESKDISCIDDKISYGITVLNSLMDELSQNPSKEDVLAEIANFASLILRILYRLVESSKEHTHSPLNKYIVRFCSKYFYMDIFTQFKMENSDDSNVLGGFLILKYRNMGVFDPHLTTIYGSLATAFQKLFNVVIAQKSRVH